MKLEGLNLVAKRRGFFAFSALLIVIVIAYSAIFGVQMDIQFQGGALLNYSYVGDVDVDALTEDFSEVLGREVTIQTGANSATGAKTAVVSLPGSSVVTPETLTALSEVLDTEYPDNDITSLEISNVSPTLGGEFFAKCLVAVAAAFVLILIYIAIRFRNIGGIPAGIMAIVALIHDLIIVFGVFVIMGIPLGGNFIAVMLTILGYSINDTVVIYDRIRENEGIYKNKMDFEPLVNLSINQSLVRSLNTTVSTIIALSSISIVALIFGLDSIFTFSFPLIIGMLSGVYSTICIAGPLWVVWENSKASKRSKNLKKARA